MFYANLLTRQITAELVRPTKIAYRLDGGWYKGTNKVRGKVKKYSTVTYHAPDHSRKLQSSFRILLTNSAKIPYLYHEDIVSQLLVIVFKLFSIKTVPGTQVTSQLVLITRVLTLLNREYHKSNV